METSTTSERGATAEAVAVEALLRAGYDIVEQNWTCDAGEIDIIARQGDVLVFVEVRSRADGMHGHAAEMVTPAKQRRVTRLAGIYLLLERPAYERCRFDVVAITGDEVEIIQDAWRVRG